MYNLLVIDDDPVFEFIAEKTLSRSNLFNKTTFYHNAGDALKFLEEHQSDADALPDLILLDLYMPVINGWDFMKKFEELNLVSTKKVPVHVLTSSINPADIKLSGKFQSIKSFISKPLTNQIIEGIFSFCNDWHHGKQSAAS